MAIDGKANIGLQKSRAWLNYVGFGDFCDSATRFAVAKTKINDSSLKIFFKNKS